MNAILDLIAADPNIDPALRAAIAPTPICPERAAYEVALRRMDWHFEFADDGEVYRRGRDALAKLREQQRRIDPQGRVWLSIAPASHGVPRPIVEPIAAFCRAFDDTVTGELT